MNNRESTTVRDDLKTTWVELDWPKLEEIVNRAQVRIARAALNGDWKKVTELQRMLVNSFAAKAMAVKSVTSSQGARTPGVDKEIWDTPEKKMAGTFAYQKELPA